MWCNNHKSLAAKIRAFLSLSLLQIYWRICLGATEIEGEKRRQQHFSRDFTRGSGSISTSRIFFFKCTFKSQRFTLEAIKFYCQCSAVWTCCATLWLPPLFGVVLWLNKKCASGRKYAERGAHSCDRSDGSYLVAFLMSEVRPTTFSFLSSDVIQFAWIQFWKSSENRWSTDRHIDLRRQIIWLMNYEQCLINYYSYL